MTRPAYVNVRELEAAAQAALDPVLYDYFAGGAQDEVTVGANEAAFRRLTLVPRVLRGAGPSRLGVTLLGADMSMPILLAPTAFHQLAHPEAERATARAAARAGVTMIAAMLSTVAIEDIAAEAAQAVAVGHSVVERIKVNWNGAGRDGGPPEGTEAGGAGPSGTATDSRAGTGETGTGETGPGRPVLWFQLYVQPDLGFTEALVRRAEAAGCQALVVTVDSAALGRRERDDRNDFHDLPPGVRCENLRELRGNEPGHVRQVTMSPDISWRHLDWLRGITRLPILLKGVLHPADARLAVDRGVDGLIVSNHGGRQLDTTPATIDQLPQIADVVDGRVPLLLDGGVRRGTDVVKALALGAAAVAIGRPAVWGLAAAGEDGVTTVFELLRNELANALTLCGCASPHDVTPDLVGRAPLDEPAPGGRSTGRRTGARTTNGDGSVPAAGMGTATADDTGHGGAAMKVIGAGVGRTGTMSLKVALEQLGFGPCFHGRHVLDHRERLPLWMAAASGQPVDLAGLFAGYGSTMDWPGAAFWRELVAAFPEAKVILTVRDPESWYDSVSRTIYPMFGSRSDPRAAKAREVVPGLDVMTEFTRRLIWDGPFFGGRFEDREHAIAVFEAHNAAVRREVPAERLLVCGADVGWPTLCEFLEVPAPDDPYPHLNDPSGFWGRVEARMAEARAAAAASASAD